MSIYETSNGKYATLASARAALRRIANGGAL